MIFVEGTRVFDKYGNDYLVSSDYGNPYVTVIDTKSNVHLSFNRNDLLTQLTETEKKKNVEVKINPEQGMKFDNQKVRPGLLFRSMPEATMSVINVLEYGARKYAPDNWSKVEDERYEEAFLRHIMSYFSGENNDPETNEPHLAHAICCMLFLIQKEINRNKEKSDAN